MKKMACILLFLVLVSMISFAKEDPIVGDRLEDFLAYYGNPTTIRDTDEGKAYFYLNQSDGVSQTFTVNSRGIVIDTFSLFSFSDYSFSKKFYEAVVENFTSSLGKPDINRVRNEDGERHESFWQSGPISIMVYLKGQNVGVIFAIL